MNQRPNYPFYVGTGLANRGRAVQVINALQNAGHTITYDWTVHGSVGGQDKKVLAATASMEIQGARTARAGIILLPGGRGTHTELGAFLALGKPVLLVDETPDKRAFRTDVDPLECVFYHHPLIIQMPFTVVMTIQDIVREAELMVEWHERLTLEVRANA